jgi:uncharacterized protein (TIGR01370 family)
MRIPAYLQLVVFLALLSAGAHAAPANARQRPRDAKNWYCYYGPDRVSEQAKYDLVILHTPAATPQVVRQLKDLGVVTIGYISVGADETVRVGNGKGPAGKASWYFDKDKDAQPDIDPVWKSPWANTADPAWRADRVAEARRLVEQCGFDGIFLDTTDNVTIYPEMFDGMVELIESFRRELPEAPIIMNQSWELLRRVATSVDGVMLEGFTTSYDFENKRHRRNPINWDDNGLRQVNKHVMPLRKQHGLAVVVLDYADQNQMDLIQAAADRAASFGFIHCVSTVRLDEIYHYNVTPKADPKYLKPQATPESMSVTLDTPRNGFPAGTVVMPSGCFGGYSVAPIVDGVEDRSKLQWSQVSWASAEDGEPAWVEIRLPEPRAGGELFIEWENGHSSRAFDVQVKESANGLWRDVRKVTHNRTRQCTIELPEKYRVVRINQQPGDGSDKRPDLMWISRIKLKS